MSPSAPCAVCGHTRQLGHVCSTCHPSPAVELRRALDAKDALLRRALTLARAIRVREPVVRPGAYTIELEGLHIGDVSRLAYDLGVEFEYEDVRRLLVTP